MVIVYIKSELLYVNMYSIHTFLTSRLGVNIHLVMTNNCT
jgi:hypothetical protein